MPLYLLDTNVLSRVARGIDKEISEKIARHVEDCVLSSVAWYELQYGAARSSDPVKSAARLKHLRAVFPFVRPFGEEDATEAASVSLRTCQPWAWRSRVPLWLSGCDFVSPPAARQPVPPQNAG